MSTQFQGQEFERDKTLWYHGTSLENARGIVENGFERDTWFAPNMADSFYTGGDVIFGIAQDWDMDDPISEDDCPPWQIHTNDHCVQTDKIVGIFLVQRIYNALRTEDDPPLGDQSKALLEAITNLEASAKSRGWVEEPKKWIR
jgi:hypothetical protein